MIKVGIFSIWQMNQTDLLIEMVRLILYPRPYWLIASLILIFINQTDCICRRLFLRYVFLLLPKRKEIPTTLDLAQQTIFTQSIFFKHQTMYGGNLDFGKWEKFVTHYDLFLNYLHKY